MPSLISERTPIDETFKGSLQRLKGRDNWEEFAQRLKSEGFQVTAYMLQNMGGLDHHSKQKTVPRDLYARVVGQEPETVERREFPTAIRRIAFWYCFFFDTSLKKLSIELMEEAREFGLEYTQKTVYSILDKSTVITIDSAWREVLTKKFNKASGGRELSHKELEELVEYFDSIHPGWKNPGRVSWEEAMPTLRGLVSITGKKPYRVIKQHGIKTAPGERATISVQEYFSMRNELQQQPAYAELSKLCSIISFTGEKQWLPTTLPEGTLRHLNLEDAVRISRLPEKDKSQLSVYNPVDYGFTADVAAGKSLVYLPPQKVFGIIMTPLEYIRKLGQQVGVISVRTAGGELKKLVINSADPCLIRNWA